MLKELIATFSIIIISTFCLTFSIITSLNTRIVNPPQVYYFQETTTTENETTTIKTIIMFMDNTKNFSIPEMSSTV